MGDQQPQSDAGGGPGPSSSASSGPVPWFNDRRFHFANSADRIRQNFTQLLNEKIWFWYGVRPDRRFVEVAESVQQYPELVNPARQQIQLVSELLSTMQEETTAGAANVPPAGGVALQMDAEEEEEEEDEQAPAGHEQAQVEQPVDDDNNWMTDDEGEGVDGAAAAHVDQAQQVNNELQRDLRRLLRLLRSPEIQKIVKLILHLVPFVLIFLVKFLLNHWSLLFAASLIPPILVYANHQCRACCTEGCQYRSQIAGLVKVILLCLFYLSLVHLLLFDGEQLYLALVFRLPPHWHSHMAFCDTLWLLLCSDLTIKLAFICLKMMATMVPVVGESWWLGRRRRRRLIQSLEYTSQLYQFLVPVPIICAVLLAEHDTAHTAGGEANLASAAAEEGGEVQEEIGLSRVLSYGLAGTYLLVKLLAFKPVLSNWMKSFSRLWVLNEYGKRPSLEQIKTSNGCAICFAAEFNGPPLQLNCGHIFCEECVTTWLDKERTCPMCRKQVISEDNSWKDGSTSFWLHLF